MTTLKKIFLVLIILFLITAILRETRFLQLNFYTSNINSSSNAEWHSKNSIVTVGYQNVKPEVKKPTLSCIILLNKDTLYKKIDGPSPILITVSSFESGPLWTPLYKSANFSAVGSVAQDHKSTFTATNVHSSSKSSLSGNLSISGHVLIKGLCSRRQANKLIKDIIVENFVTEAKKHLSN